MAHDLRHRIERRYKFSQLPVTQLVKAPTDRHGHDFTASMTALGQDIARRCPAFTHIDMTRVMVTATISRTSSLYGLQARVTPMRFRDGSLTTRRRNVLYGLQRYYVEDREMLYLLTFVMPRFLKQSFEEKLTTVFHELYHMSPAFDGDIRRLGGRCSVHSHSKKGYDDQMRLHAREYLKEHDQPAIFEFLKWSFDDYQKHHGGTRVVVVPRPRLVPISLRAEC